MNYGDYEIEGSSRSIVQKRPPYKVGRVVEEGGILEKFSLANVVVLCVSAIVGGFLMPRLITLA